MSDGEVRRWRVALCILCAALVLCGAVLALIALSSVAHAHDEWANGTPVPAWVKDSCCGPADAHHLTPDMVHRDGDFYRVDGYQRPIPVGQALPSQDGDYWIFYKDEPEGDTYSPEGGRSHHAAYQTGVYCFFVPMEF